MKRVAVVLAAGAAKRFGGGKLDAYFKGEPLLHHAIRAARSAPVERVLVVAAPGQAIGDWAGEPPVECVPLASAALSESLSAGIAAADAAGADAVFVYLGDMPLVPRDVPVQLAQTLDRNFAAMPVCGDKPGHPVLFARAAFAQLRALTGDAGAGSLLRDRSDVARVPVDDPGVLLDVDVPADIPRLGGGSTIGTGT